MNAKLEKISLSRRGFFGLAAAATATTLLPTLTSCSAAGTGTAGGSAVLKFWDMAGSPEYVKTATDLVNGYVADGATAKYQSIQWSNYYQTFASAVASNTGPAVSSGGGYQAFQFAEQGAISYADDLVEQLKTSGAYDDFLPGTFESLKTSDGYVAVPWQIDIRVLSYRKSLLEKAGVEPPTDWDSFIQVGKALKKIGVIGYGTAAGSGALIGEQSILSLMINNGGGLFDEDGNSDCVTERNIETMEFFQEMAREGIIDPASVSYTSDNLNEDWKNHRIGMGFNLPSLKASLGETEDDIMVASPLTGPHGDQGTVYYINNLMMYKNTPSQEASEEFLAWYLDNMSVYWENRQISSLPVRQSIIETAEFQSDENAVKSVQEWQPVAKTFATRSSQFYTPMAAASSGQAFAAFAQQVLEGKTSPKDVLERLQKGFEEVM